MSKVIAEVQGKQDERLTFVLGEVKKATEMFVKAVRDSSDEHQSISFRAFTLKTDKEEEVKAVFDLIMMAVAVELKEQADDLISKYTFFNSKETNDSGDEQYLFLHVRKVAPPTKEEVEKMIEAEASEAALPIPEEAERCD